MKIAIGFTPFQLVYGLEAILPIQCQIPSLQLAIELLPDTSAEEEIFLYLNNLDETRRDASLANEAPHLESRLGCLGSLFPWLNIWSVQERFV